MYKTLIFDLGKVLIPFDFRLGYQALQQHCPYAEPEIRRRIAATGLVERLEKGLIEPRDFVSQFSRALDLNIEYKPFCELWSCIFHGQLISDSIIQSLASRYRLLLLSNTNQIHFESIRCKYPVIRYFHDLVLSFEVHAMKPEPAIYRAALARAGCRPDECFYTDDIADFVEAARWEGIDAVQFRSPQQLEQEMRTRGIRW